MVFGNNSVYFAFKASKPPVPYAFFNASHCAAVSVFLVDPSVAPSISISIVFVPVGLLLSSKNAFIAASSPIFVFPWVIVSVVGVNPLILANSACTAAFTWSYVALGFLIAFLYTSFKRLNSAAVNS